MSGSRPQCNERVSSLADAGLWLRKKENIYKKIESVIKFVTESTNLVSSNLNLLPRWRKRHIQDRLGTPKSRLSRRTPVRGYSLHPIR